MARPLRLEIPGGLYHITTRGNRREAIYLGDDDRHLFLHTLGQVCARFSWGVYAWCLMGNHYHLLVEISLPNLSRGMRQLNGVYTQRFNRRHDRTGHVFEGRFKAQLVQKDSYLMAASRYIVLNPVRAGLVREPGDWPWSSYNATIGRAQAPAWLYAGELLGMFSGRQVPPALLYARFVRDGIKEQAPWDKAQRQAYLGDGNLPDRVRPAPARFRSREIPRAHRRPLAKKLNQYRRGYADRDEAMARAYLSGVFTMREIGDHFGVHYMTVSRAVRRFESARRQPA